MSAPGGTVPSTVRPPAAVGRSIPRLEGREKVSGAARYDADVELPGMLYGLVLRSPYPHARIAHIDASRALALEGVKAVVTYEDAPPQPIEAADEALMGDGGDEDAPQPDPVHVLDRTVRFAGDEVLAVCAVDEATALAALALIEVRYEPLPFVLDPLEAVEPGAPRVRGGRTNVAGGKPVRIARGDVAAGFAQADLVIEGTYSTPFASGTPLEARVTVARWHEGADGPVLDIWKTSRWVFGDRRSLARVFGLSPERVRIRTAHVGASYGNKDESRSAYIAALLAKKAGAPVRLAYTRQEEMIAGRLRHSSHTTLRVGVTKRGEITAIEAVQYMATGPYVPGTGVAARSGYGLTYLYHCPNVSYTGYVVYTHTPTAGSFRGLGAPQGHLAMEVHMDRVAEALGMDPLAFRLKNAVRPEGQPGEWQPTGEIVPDQPAAGGIPFSSNGLRECLERGAEVFGYVPRPNGRPALRSHPERPWVKIGQGMAMLIYKTGKSQAQAEVCLTPDGRAEVRVGNVDVGQGSATVLAQLAAEVLALGPERVRVSSPDTDAVMSTHMTAGSATTFSAGSAVIEAARQALARRERGEAPDPQAGGWIGQASLRPGSTTHIVNSFGAHFCEVEVDTETGEVAVTRYVAAHDSGRIINPHMAENQVIGGVTQGIGYALSEVFRLDEGTGRALNASLYWYRVPFAHHVPPIDVVFADIVDPVGPFGAKSLGEPPIVAPAPAILNAIYDATGIRFTALPVSPARLLEALEEREAVR
ncbi:MAG TPA: xanthine dehydrogenase family protein molybdopterin-binding subunit [Limnochordia bacterium]